MGGEIIVRDRDAEFRNDQRVLEAERLSDFQDAASKLLSEGFRATPEA